MIKTIPEQNAPQANPLIETAHEKKQRLDYIEATKKQNVILKLEAEKFEYMYKALSYKMGLNQLRAQLLAEEEAEKNQTKVQVSERIEQGPWPTPTPDQEVPTSPYDAEATTSGVLEEIPPTESRPIMEVHHRDVLAD